MRIDSRPPVHVDAKAKIRPRIFLGGNYSATLPGRRARRIWPRRTIPLDRTGTRSALRRIQIFRADTRRTRTACRSFQYVEAGGALLSRLAALPPYAYVHAVVNQRCGPGPALPSDSSRLRTSPRPSTRPCARSRITDFNITLGALAARGQLGHIAELPARCAPPSPRWTRSPRVPADPPGSHLRAARRVVGPRSRALIPRAPAARLVSARSSRAEADCCASLRDPPGQCHYPLLASCAASSCQNEGLPVTRDRSRRGVPFDRPVYEDSVSSAPRSRREPLGPRNARVHCVGTGGVETFSSAPATSARRFPFLAPPPKPAVLAARPDVPARPAAADLRTIPWPLRRASPPHLVRGAGDHRRLRKRASSLSRRGAGART